MLFPIVWSHRIHGMKAPFAAGMEAKRASCGTLLRWTVRLG